MAQLTQSMQTTVVTRFFPDSAAFLVHQTGAQIAATSAGVEIVLHTRKGEQRPCCAELISGDHHAEIGLWFEGKELSDYDGAFSLPREIGVILQDVGYVVADEFFA